LLEDPHSDLPLHAAPHRRRDETSPGAGTPLLTMSIATALGDVYRGFRSLLIGLRITGREATKHSLTVQYPHETLKMPERFRGHIKLVLDPVTGRSRCTACNLCVR